MRRTNLISDHLNPYPLIFIFFLFLDPLGCFNLAGPAKTHKTYKFIKKRISCGLLLILIPLVLVVEVIFFMMPCHVPFPVKVICMMDLTFSTFINEGFTIFLIKEKHDMIVIFKKGTFSKILHIAWSCLLN